jgi:hypothetical protein
MAGGDPPFATWEYRAPYLPAGMSFKVGKNADVLTEPGLFHLPFGRRPDCRPAEQEQPLDHAAGLREISRVELASPRAHLSPEMSALASAGLLQVARGSNYLVQLSFDCEPRGQTMDFRPTLPLVFRL